MLNSISKLVRPLMFTIMLVILISFIIVKVPDLVSELAMKDRTRHEQLMYNRYTMKLRVLERALKNVDEASPLWKISTTELLEILD